MRLRVLNFVHVAFFVVSFLFVSSTAAFAQRFDAGGQVVFARSSEFDRGDTGVGGRFAWHPVDLIGAEAEMTFYPGDFPSSGGFSRSRIEGLFGVTVGPRIARVRPFAKLRPGFLTFR